MTGFLERDSALRALRDGGVIGMATDTVYGVAASLGQPAAIAALFALKRRPRSVALPILADSLEAIEQLGIAWEPRARRLSDALWPGALTIVVSVPHELAVLVGGTGDSAGFRVPDDDDLRGLLHESGPLVVSSANEHGEVPSRNAADVLRSFAERDEFRGVLDGGERGGEASTVVVLEENSWRVARAGTVGTRDLARYLD
ncbi:MAG: threonylcarbamoyl-AMP synthase [Acidimicrobiaceae bacterium]|nr:threonylcarbamoyl-AMP synthase [Acidimicrobiaceae bacterium]